MARFSINLWEQLSLAYSLAFRRPMQISASVHMPFNFWAHRQEKFDRIVGPRSEMVSLGQRRAGRWRKCRGPESPIIFI
jgi:hypothetical protein